MMAKLGLGVLVLLFWIALERRLRRRIFEATGGTRRVP